MTAKAPKNPERSFGISVGLVLIAIAAALWWRGRVGRAEILGGVGALLLAGGLVHPPLLKYPSAAWWRFALALGYINARVLLTILFAIVLVPISLVWRLTGKDPLARRRDKWPGWSPYPARYRDRKHYERMY
jgi:saxitoxin biosynthesis operon SxtJ-like protein